MSTASIEAEMDGWMREYLPRLLSEVIDADVLAEVVHRIEGVDQRDLDLIGDLLPSLSSRDLKYLDSWLIDRFIAAECDDAALIESIEKSRRRLERIRMLLPEVIRLLGKKTNYGVRFAIHVLHDTVRDFEAQRPEGRRDKILNAEIRTLRSSRQSLERALAALKTLNDIHPIARDYQTLAHSYHEIEHKLSQPDMKILDPALRFETLLQHVSFVSASIDLALLDLKSAEPRESRPTPGMNKSDIVSLAYELHRVCLGPQLVTTPGSDFSYLCSLIYEMATGKADEGLTGAIAEFARSRERQETDEYESELEADELAHDANDNFHLVRTSVERLRRDALWLATAAGSDGFDEPTRIAVARAAVSLLERAERESLENGPFIVWAEHSPRAQREAWKAEHAKWKEEERKIRIALGKLRRVKLADN